jgi:hypothetical protein
VLRLILVLLAFIPLPVRADWVGYCMSQDMQLPEACVREKLASVFVYVAVAKHSVAKANIQTDTILRSEQFYGNCIDFAANLKVFAGGAYYACSTPNGGHMMVKIGNYYYDQAAVWSEEELSAHSMACNAWSDE